MSWIFEKSKKERERRSDQIRQRETSNKEYWDRQVFLVTNTFFLKLLNTNKQIYYKNYVNFNIQI